MEQLNSKSKWADLLILVIALCSVLAFVVLTCFAWFDVYHRISHAGAGINLCDIYAQLTRQPLQQVFDGTCR